MRQDLIYLNKRVTAMDRQLHTLVALANKNVWIAWVLLSKATDYLPTGEPALA
jgi:hypothetical protein